MGFNTYNVGDRPRLTITCRDPENGDALTDPDALFVTVLAPDGTITTYEFGVNAALMQSSTGIFYVDQAVDQHGSWFYYGYTTGTWQGAEENRFDVRRSRVAEALAEA